MKMAKTSKPKIMRSFENFLWIHSPKHWIFKSTYFQSALFVSISVETTGTKQAQKVRRNFRIEIIDSRKDDISGLASDCIDEMKRNLKD